MTKTNQECELVFRWVKRTSCGAVLNAEEFRLKIWPLSLFKL